MPKDTSQPQSKPSIQRRAVRPVGALGKDQRGDTVIRVDFKGVREPPRDNLTLQSWLNRKMPPRDYLLGELLSTTSRWLIIGDTGIGKTLLALAIAAASAAR